MLNDSKNCCGCDPGAYREGDSAVARGSFEEGGRSMRFWAIGRHDTITIEGNSLMVLKVPTLLRIL